MSKPARPLRAHLALSASLSLCVVAALVALQPASAASTATILSGGPPHWYNAEFHRAVIAAGAEGSLLPAAAALPSSSLAFPGIRPGAWMIYPNWCTMNFIFSSTGWLDGGPYYIGTAAHCVDRVGGFVVVAVSPTPGALPRAVAVGTVSHITSVSGDQVIGSDFALVRIDSALSASISPSMTLVGGPTGVYRGASVVAVLQAGHGAVLGTGGMARAGSAVSYSSTYPHGYGMALLAVIGDSGSPVRTSSGEALGNVTHIGVDLTLSFVPGNAFGTRVTRVESDWGLKVVTCSSASPWTGLGCPT